MDPAPQYCFYSRLIKENPESQASEVANKTFALVSSHCKTHSTVDTYMKTHTSRTYPYMNLRIRISCMRAENILLYLYFFRNSKKEHFLTKLSPLESNVTTSSL
jgi:hypothetical protein